MDPIVDPVHGLPLKIRDYCNTYLHQKHERLFDKLQACKPFKIPHHLLLAMEKKTAFG